MANRGIRVGHAPVNLLTAPGLALMEGERYVIQNASTYVVRFSDVPVADGAPDPDSEEVSFHVSPGDIWVAQIDATSPLWAWCRGSEGASLRVNEVPK